MDNTADALGVYNLVVSALLHEGLTCALAAKRFGLLDDHGKFRFRFRFRVAAWLGWGLGRSFTWTHQTSPRVIRTRHDDSPGAGAGLPAAHAWGD